MLAQAEFRMRKWIFLVQNSTANISVSHSPSIFYSAEPGLTVPEWCWCPCHTNNYLLTHKPLPGSCLLPPSLKPADQAVSGEPGQHRYRGHDSLLACGSIRNLL